jgi:carboxyl-terminal processing protease
MQKRVLGNLITAIAAGSLLLLVFFSSCKKNAGVKPSTDSTTSTVGTSLSTKDEDSLKYYIYHYMQVTITEGADTVTKIPQYYWYSQVPALNPFSSAYDSAEDLLNAIISYPVNPQTGGPIDRYSFLDRTGEVAAQDLNGMSGTGVVRPGNLATANTISGDLGFEAGYAEDGSGNLYLFVLYVYANSSAGLQGVQRGWQITAINGNTDISNTSLVNNAIYNSASSTFIFAEPSGATTTLTISASNYTLTPVLFDTVYDFNSVPVGYFVFKQFVDVYNSSGAPTVTKTELDDVFTKFKNANVKDVIVDLRYNTGGSVTTAEYIDSLLAPLKAANQLMYTYKYNDKITANINQLGFTQQVNFGSTTGGLNLDNVFFITDNLTASASELTINNLRPYETVKLVGDTTYGKPVGFFDWPIYDYDSAGNQQFLADLYDINYATYNSQGIGDYYQGFPPDYLDGDYINIPWGNLNDPDLVDIENYIDNGEFRTTANARLTNQLLLPKLKNSAIHNPRLFVGMVDYKLSKKIQASQFSIIR